MEAGAVVHLADAQSPSIQAMAQIGRPALYTRELADTVLRRLAEGESLRAICRDDNMPARATVSKWVTQNTDGFADQYARARDEGLDVLADDILDISDETGAKVVHQGEQTDVVMDAATIARNRLRVDARKWYLSKLAPKRYGDKTTVEHEGGVTISVMTGVPTPGEDLV